MPQSNGICLNTTALNAKVATTPMHVRITNLINGAQKRRSHKCSDDDADARLSTGMSNISFYAIATLRPVILDGLAEMAEEERFEARNSAPLAKGKCRSGQPGQSREA
jgi:hypothetical protein